MIKIKRALISVHDKAGLPELAASLKACGCTLISTGGTAKHLAELGYVCEEVESVTGFPAIMNGRVKTLHPHIFGGILSRRSQPDIDQMQQHQIQAIDLVVVNLYPFTQQLTSHAADLSHMVEYIDIGGVSLIRAAAKNHAHCVVLTEPQQYASFIAQLQQHQGCIDLPASGGYARQAFIHTATYDANIAQWLSTTYPSTASEPMPQQASLNLEKCQELVYGENPHQQAAFYSTPDNAALPKQLAGKALSYNNWLDLDTCLGIVADFHQQAAVVIVKHANPCGIGVDASATGNMLLAYERALAADPVSAFGGIVGLTMKVEADLATELTKKFYEMIIAPDFSDAAVEIFRQKPKLRLLKIQIDQLPKYLLRQTLSGYLWQSRDQSCENLQQAKVVSKRQPTADELQAMQMAWRCCKWVKSNAIVIASKAQTLGIGAGQMSRVDAVKIAIEKASLPQQSVALASDAFFPFRDSIDLAHQVGIEAIVQPGGSIRDAEVIAAADEHNLVMLFTGVRHFRH